MRTPTATAIRQKVRLIDPSVVARQVHAPALILGVWILGALIALAGTFIYAELAARLPLVGGDYAYLREAYHPVAAFLNGWALLLVMQTGAWWPWR